MSNSPSPERMGPQPASHPQPDTQPAKAPASAGPSRSLADRLAMQGAAQTPPAPAQAAPPAQPVAADEKPARPGPNPGPGQPPGQQPPSATRHTPTQTPTPGAAQAQAQATTPAQPGAAGNKPTPARPTPARPGNGQPPATARQTAVQGAAAGLPATAQPRQVTPLPHGQGMVPAGAPMMQPMAMPAGLARPRRRHWALLASFVILVVLPVATAAIYLWTRAADQYVSTMAFSVRREDQKSGLDFLGGITAFTSSAEASDTSILEDYIHSPDMIGKVMETINLPVLFSQAWPHDFWFAYDPDGTIEDLVDYWDHQVTVINDDKTGIMTVEVSAFTPQDAQEIAEAVYAASSDTINRLSDQAREDGTRHAREEFEKAENRVKDVRVRMTEFRTRTQLVDPRAEFESRMGIITELQSELASALVAQDLLLQNGAGESDQRVIQSHKRITAIEDRITAERLKFSADGAGPGGESYATLVAGYEQLETDRVFAEEAYTLARAGYDKAVADAQRQTRYLAAHIVPNLPQQSQRPDRPLLLAIFAGFVLLVWGIIALIYYSVRDRS